MSEPHIWAIHWLTVCAAVMLAVIIVYEVVL